MKKLTFVFVAVLTMASFACSEQGSMPASPAAPSSPGVTDAKGGGQPAGDVAVTSTIQGGAFDIASDGVGVYTNSTTLTSVIQSVGAWLLDSNVKGSTRNVYLGFGRLISGSGPLSGRYKARLIAQCNRAPYNTSMLTLTMPVATPMPCPLYVRFDTGGSAYRITMNSDEVAGSDDVTVTCTSPTTGPCSGWTIAPSGSSGSNVGVLYKQGRGTTWVEQGRFHFSFLFLVTNP